MSPPPAESLAFSAPVPPPAGPLHILHALLGRPGSLLSRFAEVSTPFMLLHAARSSRRCIWTGVIRLLPHLPRSLPSNVPSTVRSPTSSADWRLRTPPCGCPHSARQS